MLKVRAVKFNDILNDFFLYIIKKEIHINNIRFLKNKNFFTSYVVILK